MSEPQKPYEISNLESQIIFPPWYGELGWEVMTWAPFCRRAAQGHERVIVTTFDGMAPLYADFATEFRSNGERARSLTYPKHYRVKGLHYRYGRREKAGTYFDLLIHARGVARKSSINYHFWPQLADLIERKGWSVAWIGGPKDTWQPGCGFDLRGLELQKLMDIIAASRLVIGVSSGIMHLAAACGTDLLVWGDRRTYFGETLETRYKATWNPHQVRVGWIDADNWQPEPQRIIEEIETIINQTGQTGRTGQTMKGQQ